MNRRWPGRKSLKVMFSSAMLYVIVFAFISSSAGISSMEAGAAGMDPGSGPISRVSGCRAEVTCSHGGVFSCSAGFGQICSTGNAGFCSNGIAVENLRFVECGGIRRVCPCTLDSVLPCDGSFVPCVEDSSCRCQCSPGSRPTCSAAAGGVGTCRCTPF